MPAKKLTPEQKAEALHLKSLFKAYQAEAEARGDPHTQDALTEFLPFGQSALAQYLGGKIPLNAEAVLAFSGLLGIPAVDISPIVANQQFDFSLKWLNALAAAKYVKGTMLVERPTRGLPIRADLVDRMYELDGPQRQTLEQAIEVHLEAVQRHPATPVAPKSGEGRRDRRSTTTRRPNS